jgi:serine/threonine-protein kinase
MTAQEFQGVPKPGEVLLGKYRVDKVLGAGGMGVVVAATHLGLDEKVAIKFLLSDVARNPDNVQRFSREARAAAKIKNDHVTKVSDIGTLESGAAYMVMEYLDGEDLESRLERGPLPLVDAVRFTLQACEALAEAHKAGIIHRDLKPANLFLSKRGDGTEWVKVLDFGISKIVGDASATGGSLTQTSTAMGSPLYMAPEQMRNAKDVDSRADIWAIGTILFELCSGKRPFDGTTLPEVCSRILADPPLPLVQAMPGAPPALQAVIDRCLQKQAELRYPSLAPLAHDVAQLGDDDARRSAAFIAKVLGDSGPLMARDSNPGAPNPAQTAFQQPLGGHVDSGHTGVPQTDRISHPTIPGSPNASGPYPPVHATAPGAPGVVTTTSAASVPRPPTASQGQPKKLSIGAIAAIAIGVFSVPVGYKVVSSSTSAETETQPEPLIPVPTASASAASNDKPKSTNAWVRIDPPATPVAIGLPDDAPKHQRGLRHQLTMKSPNRPYEIQKHEVTWAEFGPWLEKNAQHDYPRSWLAGDWKENLALPASGMGWEAARDYCIGLGGRLPEEMEWEFAARGAAMNAFPAGPTAIPLSELHALEGPGAKVQPVMKSEQDRTAGAHPLYDMLGNAREWTNTEWFDGRTGMPKKEDGKVWRVLRGYHLDRCVCEGNRICRSDEPSGSCQQGNPPLEGLAFRSRLCGEGACLSGSDATTELRRKQLQSVGFRCARPI